MVWEYITKIVIEAIKGAEKSSALIELFLALGIFLIPKFFKPPRLDSKRKKKTRWVLLNNFLTHTEWRIGLAVCLFFAIHFLVVTPYRIFEEDQNKIKSEIAKASDDYISEKRAYLEATLVVESITNNEVFFHYEVENRGKLPAMSIVERQGSKEYIISDGNELTLRDLSPNGKMDVGMPYIPAKVSDEVGLKTDLTLNYISKVHGTNMSFSVIFNFAVPRYQLAPGKFNYIHSQIDRFDNIDSNEMILNKLKDPLGSVVLSIHRYQNGVLNTNQLSLGNENRRVFYNGADGFIGFRTIFSDGKEAVRTMKVRETDPNLLVISVSWGPNYIGLWVNNILAPEQ